MKNLFRYLLLFACLFFAKSVVFFNLSVNAGDIEETYLFFERMQVGKETEMILMFTPNATFESDGVLTINFMDDPGQWCLEPSALIAVPTDSSAVDISNWEIGEELPTHDGSLVASCTSNGHDQIIIENVGELESGTSYGVKILKNSNFQTSSVVGEKEVVINMDDGNISGSKQLGVNLIESDSVVVSAYVSDVNTLVCTIPSSDVEFGTLSRGGNYATKQHTLSTSSSHPNGYYWAVYGKGNGTQAGLWKSTIPTSIIPSTGSTTINLSNNPGFGLRVSTPSGNVPSHFSHSNASVFGAINSGHSNSRLIFHSGVQGSSELTVTMGVRAGASAEVGPYSETLTYLCGGLY